MVRWAARLIRFEAGEDGQVTIQRFTPEEAEQLTRPRRRSKLLQKRIEQLRARKAAERSKRAKHAAMCRWRPRDGKKKPIQIQKESQTPRAGERSQHRING
jgi:hypothetical protein